MRFTHSNQPSSGDERLRREFLWLPKKIGNETRWLEMGVWTEIYRGKLMSHYGREQVQYDWIATSWGGFESLLNPQESDRAEEALLTR